jgi:hypothetical protein
VPRANCFNVKSCPMVVREASEGDWPTPSADFGCGLGIGGGTILPSESPRVAGRRWTSTLPSYEIHYFPGGGRRGRICLVTACPEWLSLHQPVTPAATTWMECRKLNLRNERSVRIPPPPKQPCIRNIGSSRGLENCEPLPRENWGRTALPSECPHLGWAFLHPKTTR